jgi:hypothetical protein
LTAAVSAFREAAELQPNWPDPFLGLMRAFIAMDDLERGADALAQAERYGHGGRSRLGPARRGYLTRATKLAEAEELEPLTRAADAHAKPSNTSRKRRRSARSPKAARGPASPPRRASAKERLPESQIEKLLQWIPHVKPTMSLTYTTAAERDTLRLNREARYGWPEPLLAATSSQVAYSRSLRPASAGFARSMNQRSAFADGS